MLADARAESAQDVRGRGYALSVGLIVGGIVLLSIVVRYALALDQSAPWIMGDELRYAEMAKSFLDEGRLLFRDEYTSFGTAYPVLIAPAWAAAEVETAYELSKAINVVLMTMTAVVVFLWARRLATARYALVGGGLVLLMPTFEYTGTLMMENAALPAALLATYTIARTLERPILAWQLGALAAIGLAGAFRVPLLLILGASYLTAIGLDALFAWLAERRGLRASLWPFIPTLGIVVLGALAYVVVKVASGSGLSSGLGSYAFATEADYDVVGIGRWFVWHAGELALSVGFLPAVCFGLLLAAAIRHGASLTPADRAFVAVTTASAFWFVLQAAAFASRFSERIEERYMLYAAPLLLIALVVWISRALPRSTISILVASLVPALLITTIPFERLFNVSIMADTFGLIPFMRLTSFLDGGVADLRIVVAGALVVAVVSFLAFGPRLARVLFPAVVALFFVLSGYTIHGALEDIAAGARNSTGASDPDWIDDTLGHDGRVGLVYGGALAANPHAIWQTEFWNRSVRRVYALGADTILGFDAVAELSVDENGRIVPKPGSRRGPVGEPYVLTDPSLGVVGDVVAKAGQLALIRVDRRLRLGSTFDGLYADGWSGPTAGFTQYEPLKGNAPRVRVRVSRAGWGGPDVPGRVTIAAGPLRMTETGPVLARTTASRTWTIHSGQTRIFVLPVPRAPFRVEARVSPTFSPAQFGQGDTRQLGAQVSFETGR